MGTYPDENLPGTSSYTQVTPKTQPMYGVVLDLPDEFSDEIAGQRETYSPQAAKRIFPHITLRAPFTVVDPKTLAPALEAVALRYLPVRVRASGLGSFVGPTNNVLYSKVERSERLLRLHEAVVNALPDVQDVYGYAPSHQFDNWIPHITIADGVSEERLEEIMQEVQGYDPECEWEATEILLVRSETGENGSLLWTTTRSFRTPS